MSVIQYTQGTSQEINLNDFFRPIDKEFVGNLDACLSALQNMGDPKKVFWQRFIGFNVFLIVVGFLFGGVIQIFIHSKLLLLAFTLLFGMLLAYLFFGEIPYRSMMSGYIKRKWRKFFREYPPSILQAFKQNIETKVNKVDEQYVLLKEHYTMDVINDRKNSFKRQTSGFLRYLDDCLAYHKKIM